MYLYFLRSQNVVKVGIASDFASRLDAIRRGNFHHPIEVLRSYGHWDAEYIKQLEREIHKELSGVCEHNEFFSDGPEVRTVIDRLDRQFHPERFLIPQEPLIVLTQVQA
jgi:T5orf172 domain